MHYFIILIYLASNDGKISGLFKRIFHKTHIRHTYAQYRYRELHKICSTQKGWLCPNAGGGAATKSLNARQKGYRP